MKYLSPSEMKTKLFLFFVGLAILASCKTSTESDQEGSLAYRLVENSKLIEDTLYYRIDFQYPYFSSDDEKISHKITSFNDSVQTFLDNAEQTYWATDTDGAVKIIQETGASGQYELINRYEVLDTANQLISLKFETYSYALGAHGFTAINTWNLNIESGKYLKLTDVVNLSDENKLTQFNQLLVASFVNTEGCFSEEPKINSTYDKFAITSDFLVIYFEAYDLGPYSCGSAEIMVSIDELKESGLWRLTDD